MPSFHDGSLLAMKPAKGGNRHALMFSDCEIHLVNSRPGISLATHRNRLHFQDGN